MKILKAEIQNYRNIDYMLIEFLAGITGLIGPNGTGKSSFLSAVCFGLTGLVLGDDNKSDLLQWGQTKGYVRVWFEAHGKVYVIKRNIQGSVVDLREEGASKAAFASRESIDDFMLTLIDLHPRLYDKVLFIEQEGLDTLLKATHAKRADFFNDLFDASLVEKLRALIQTYIQKVSSQPDYGPEKEVTYVHIASERKDHGEKTQELTQLGEALTKLPDLTQIVEKASKPSEADIEAEVKAKQDRIEEYRKISKTLEGVSIPIFITPEREGVYQQYLMMKSKEDNKQKAETKVTTMAYPKQEKFIGPDPEATWAELKAEEHSLTEKMRLCEMGKCPTCGHAYKGSNKEKLIEKQAKNKEKMGTVLAFIEALKEVTAAKTDLTIYTEDLQRYMATLPPEVLAFDEASYKADQEVIAKQPMQIQEYREKQASATAADQAIIDLNKEITAIRKKECISDEDRQNYKNVLDTYKQVQDKQKELQGEIQGLATSIKMREERIQRILAEEEKAKKSKSYVEILTRCKDVLHRDCLPQVIVSVGITYINIKLAEWLEHFNVPFSMQIDKDCDFTVSFQGDKKPFKVLSGGQRKVAAVAFRMAVAEIFGGSIGILSLDEPTAYMDEDAKTNLVDVLTKAASRAVAINMFVFISTHETMLMNAFTQTFDMAEKKYKNTI